MTGYPLRRLIPYFLGGLGIALMVSGIVINHYRSNQNVSAMTESTDKKGLVLDDQTVKILKVDISGAVERPGVYELPYNSRVEDVLITAGGLAAKADRTYVSKTINLAQRLVDGAKIYIPFQNEINADSKRISTDPNTEMININSATSAQLDTLPGIGPATADKIVAARPYQNISELIDRKVVSQSVFDKIKDRITIY